MKKKIKREFLEIAVIGAVIAVLYFTGVLPEVMGFAQRGLLKTGLVNTLSNDPNAKESPENPPADFNLNLISSHGNRVSLNDYKGKIIFLNFWATWCPPCIAEMPDINTLYNSSDKDKFAFLMVSLDDDFEKAKDFRRKKAYDFEIYHLKGPLPEMYNSGNLPTTYLITSEGKLALTHIGIGDYSAKAFKDFFKNLE